MPIVAAYRRLLTAQPKMLLAALLALLAFLAYHAQNFELDASPDSLLLEDDPDLLLVRQIAARYESRELLLLTYTVTDDLFSTANLEELRGLRDELRGIAEVDSVMTILDVPLLQSSDVPLLEMLNQVQTLESDSIDRERARTELTESPVFRELVISADGQTTALVVSLKDDAASSAQIRERNELLIQRGESGLDAEETSRLTEVSAAYDAVRATLNERRHLTILDVRAVIAAYNGEAQLNLGGVPMIADDMITFVRSDLITFGAGVFAFVVLVLLAIFRRLRWVALPIASCAYASITMLGLLGLVGWEVTVISSNFLALMLIITISMNIHLAVRYLQLARDEPELEQPDLVWLTLEKMVWPCLYTAVTTIIGFASLVFSNIKPVQDFGLMMSAGLSVAFLSSFTVFPAVLVLIGKPKSSEVVREEGLAIVLALARFSERRGSVILATAGALAILSGVGISRLEVENSFIDYFREDTEIYQGMRLIDQKLGGTTPLEVILHMAPVDDPDAGFGVTFDDDEEFYDDYELDLGPEYWFTARKISVIKKVHDYLDALPHIGKVLSLASLIRVAEEINDGEELDSLDLSVLYTKLPADVRRDIVDPYFDFEADEARITLRILDSDPDLRRGQLLARIRSDLHNELGLSDDEVTVTGTMVLYNNMLQSLYTSQVSSLGAVMVGITLTLLLLFRSFPLAIIGLVPNLLAAGVVLGIMGLAGIPLDVMTITISAISIGIAVDNAIHYIYRFQEEYAQNGDYAATLYICHGSIGRAVLYTSATIIIGFSILTLSNFLPTIYFGMLTSLAMGIALLGALTLLPRLILYWRPF